MVKNDRGRCHDDQVAVVVVVAISSDGEQVNDHRLEADEPREGLGAQIEGSVRGSVCIGAFSTSAASLSLLFLGTDVLYLAFSKHITKRETLHTCVERVFVCNISLI